MSEDKAPGTAIAVVAAQSPVAIWDTNDFAQMKRVGIVLAQSGLVSESICIGKYTDETGREVTGYLGDTVVAARCTLICNQARLWGADPLAVIQCTSLINGRLMYEGKLINAVVQSLTGVKLRFELGVWDTDHIDVPEDKSLLNGIGERLGIRCFDPEDMAREISGSVGMWKTTRSGSPWSAVGNWPRQLRYRAAREWARAFEPGAILGILADGDQEIEEIGAPRASGVMGRLSGSQNGAGFDHADVEKQTRKPRAKAADKATPAAQDGAGQAEGTETASAPSVDAGPATSGSAGPASGDLLDRVGSGQPEASPPTSDGGPAPDVIAEGYPQPDEIYMLNGDEWELDPKRGTARRDTYKNGEPFSDAGRDKGYAIYEDHAPEQSSQTAGAAAEVDAEETEGESEGDEPSFPPEFTTFIDAVEAAKTWLDGKQAMATFYNTEYFKGLPVDQQNRVRSNTWEQLVENKVEGLPDHATDVSAFRLWIEHERDVDAIKGTLQVLERQPTFEQKDDGFKNQIRNAARVRIDAIEGGHADG